MRVYARVMKKVTSIFRGREEVEKMADIIAATFKDFDAPIEIVEAVEGYASYHFYIRPIKPMRMKAFAGFMEDLQYALSNDSVVIQAPIPNKKLVGITVQKKKDLQTVSFSDALGWKEFRSGGPLEVPLGIDEFGDHHLLNITRMPHMLLAGTTGSGKSVLLHSLINALLEKHTPDELRLIFVDSKRIELTLYDELPHLLTPTITQPKKAVQAFSWVIKEMERRYDILEAEGMKDIKDYHEKIFQPTKQAWERSGSKYNDKIDLPESLPYVLVVVDELSDLMFAYPRETEACLLRLTQMSRGVGIHLVLATSRLSKVVITGTIKANIPTRIALMVATSVDSRTILDTVGAEKLRGKGDMLYQVPDNLRPLRLQGPFISEEEIIERVKNLRESSWADEANTLDLCDSENDIVFNAMVGSDLEDDDVLYENAKEAVIKAGKASTSYIQRALRVGYSRAARLLDLLEEDGVIGPQDGTKPREVFKDR